MKEWVGGDDGWNDGDPHPSTVSLGTYHQFWSVHYSNLKVSPLHEDICPLCYKYANHRRFALTPSQLFLLAEGPGKKAGVSNSTEDTQPKEESAKEPTVSEQSGKWDESKESAKESAIATRESSRALDGGGDDQELMEWPLLLWMKRWSR